MKTNRSFFKTAGIWNSILHAAIPVIGLLIASLVLIFRALN
jgi:hypothetical protein